MKPSPSFQLTKKNRHAILEYSVCAFRRVPKASGKLHALCAALPIQGKIRVCSVALSERPGPLDLKEAAPKEKYATLPER